MRYLMIAIAVLALFVVDAATPAPADACSQYVSGYYTRDGRYVNGYYRSCPDSSFSNNWSSAGNTNPYTGQPGYRQPSSGLHFPSYDVYDWP